MRISSGETRRTSLLFEHALRSTSDSSDVTSAREILSQVCSADDVRPNTPELFSRLVYVMRRLDVTSLRRLRQAVDGNSVCARNDDAAKYDRHSEHVVIHACFHSEFVSITGSSSTTPSP